MICMYMCLCVLCVHICNICVICVYMCVCVCICFSNRVTISKSCSSRTEQYILPERNILEKVKFRTHKSRHGDVSFLQARTFGTWYPRGAQ